MTLIIDPEIEFAYSGISSVQFENKYSHRADMKPGSSNGESTSQAKISTLASGLMASELINGGWLDEVLEKQGPWRAHPPIVVIVSWGNVNPSLVNAFSKRGYDVHVRSEDDMICTWRTAADFFRRKMKEGISQKISVEPDSPIDFSAMKKSMGASLVIADGIPESLSPDRARRLFKEISKCSVQGTLVALSCSKEILSHKEPPYATANFADLAKPFGFYERSSHFLLTNIAPQSPFYSIEQRILEVSQARQDTWYERHLSCLTNGNPVWAQP